ncbi:unnamed protein product [Linum trigynum]|uniref:Uncharacterized protein n=1 Tax=Linum trigynum TaxID=586398 RepID=A0AAV2G422_9ROSI
MHNFFQNHPNPAVPGHALVNFVNNNLGVTFKQNILETKAYTPEKSFSESKSFCYQRIINRRELASMIQKQPVARIKQNHSSTRVRPRPRSPIPFTNHQRTRRRRIRYGINLGPILWHPGTHHIPSFLTLLMILAHQSRETKLLAFKDNLVPRLPNPPENDNHRHKNRGLLNNV